MASDAENKKVASKGKPGNAQPDPEHEEDSMSPEGGEDSDMREFLAHLDQHMPKETQTFGEVLEVPVVGMRDDMVLVDVGGKAEAAIALDEFPIANGKVDLKVGQLIAVIQVGRESDGSPKYSHREARHRQSTVGIQKAFNDKTPVKGRVTSVVKGGVMVDCGIPAFMPASQVDLFKIPDLNTMVGQDLEAYVIEYDGRRRRAVLSRRQLLFERRESDRRHVIEGLAAGSTVKGKVKSAIEFGVFVDLGGVDGFIPREEVSFDRGTPPSRILKAGDQVEVQVVNVDPANGKITLSRKRLLNDPWAKAGDRFKVGEIVQGTVVSIQNYGAFVQIEEGITAMVHAGDMSWTPGNKNPNDFVKAGDTITAQILEVDAAKRRMSLGLKQVTGDPWSEVEGKHPVGSKVTGTVTSLTNYGAFVKISDTLEGMVHVSDIVWEKRLNHPKDVLKVGDSVTAVVLKADASNRRLSLGMKQLQDSPYDAYQRANPVGTVTSGKVTRFAPFGAFVQLADGLEGLIHISQIDTKRVELPEKALTMGEEVAVKIIKYEPKNRKISLSRKDAMRQAERAELKQYMNKGKEEGKNFNSFGDALREARKDSGKG